jgi:hypothetical protein
MLLERTVAHEEHYREAALAERPFDGVVGAEDGVETLRELGEFRHTRNVAVTSCVAGDDLARFTAA